MKETYEERIRDLEQKLKEEREKLSGDAAAWEAAFKAEIEKLQQFVSEWDSIIKSLNVEVAGRDEIIEKREKVIEELKTQI